MLNPELYYAVYLIIVSIYTISLAGKYKAYPDSRLKWNGKISSKSALILTIIMSLFIGLRPKHSVFTDMSNYDETFKVLRARTFEFNSDTTNKIFDNIMSYLATNGYDISLFFFLIAAIYFWGIYFASKKLFPKDTLYAVVIYLGAFSTFSYATNGIKAGAAAVLFLCALGYYRKKVVYLILLLASVGFHHSMLMPVIACVIASFYRKPKVYLWGWLFALLIAAAHITFFQNLLGSLSDQSGSSYLITENISDSIKYITGFRMDFIIYSMLPIISGCYAIFRHGYRSEFYNWIFCTYLLANATWMVCMYANFTNRIAYLSWFMLPIVLVYPFFDKQFVVYQYRKLNLVAMGHLGFTIMMEVVYYGLLNL